MENSNEKKDFQDPWLSIPKEEEVPLETGFLDQDENLNKQINHSTGEEDDSNFQQSKVNVNSPINPQIVTSFKNEFKNQVKSYRPIRDSSIFKKFTKTKLVLQTIGLIILVYIIVSLFIIL